MKRVLSLLLALSLMFSLCACSGGSSEKGKIDEGSGNAQVVSQTGDPTAEPTTEPPKKVVGERVPLGGDTKPGVVYMPTSWELGEVDPADVFADERMPLDPENMRMTVMGDVDGGGSMSMLIISKGEEMVFELDVAKDDLRMKSSFFAQDGQPYMSLYQQNGDETFAELYRLIDVEEADDTETDVDVADLPEGAVEDEPAVVDGELDEGFTVDSITDSFGVGGWTVGENENYDPENFVTCEYVGLIGDSDTFKATTKKGEELLVQVDHTTGWIIGVNLTKAVETESLQNLAVRISYDAGEFPVYDVSEAVDMDAGEAAFVFIAQMLMLADVGDMTVAED